MLTITKPVSKKTNSWTILVFYVVLAVAGLFAFFNLVNLQPQLQFQVSYNAAQLGDRDNFKAGGFYAPQTDDVGNAYVWTQDRAAVLVDYHVVSPLKLNLAIRSAAIASGPDVPVQVLVNGKEIGQLQPDPLQKDFSDVTLNFTPPPDIKFIATPLKIEFVTTTFQPANKDRRNLGTMIKQVSLDNSPTWEGFNKRAWLWLSLPGLALAIIVLGWLGNRYQSRWFRFGAIIVCLVTIGFLALVLATSWRTGALIGEVHNYWLASGIGLLLILGVTLVSLPFKSTAPTSVLAWTYQIVRNSIVRGQQRRTALRLEVAAAGQPIRRRWSWDWLLILLLYGAMTLGFMSPIASATDVLPEQIDAQNHVSSIVEARWALEEGQFPIRVAPWQNNGWRYPYYQFYGQLPYTLGGLIYRYITPDNPYKAYLALIWAFLVIGAFYTYRAGYWLTRSKPAAILAGGLFVGAPYALIQVDTQNFFSEAIGRAALAVLTYYTIRLYVRPSWWLVILSGLWWFVIATSHTITFVYSTLFIGLLVLMLAIVRIRRKKTWQALLRIGLGYILGWLLSLYFIAPIVLFQQNLRQITNFFPNPYTYNWITPLPGLLSPTSVPPEPLPGRQRQTNLNPAVGWPLLVAWATLLYYYFTPKLRTAWPSWLRRTRRFVLPMLVLFALAFFMTWSPVDFWQFVPSTLHVVQWTWRILTYVVWAGVLITAYALVLLFGKKMDGRHIALGVLLIGLAGSSYMPTQPSTSRTIADLIKKPYLVYAQDAYFYYRQITSLPVYGNQDLALYDDTKLLIDRQQWFQTWWPGEKPLLHIEGELLPQYVYGTVDLLAVTLNITDRTKIAPGAFKWVTPLDKIPITREVYPLGFSTGDDKKAVIKPTAIYVDNLPPERTLMPVTVTSKIMTQKGATTTGLVNVPKTANLVQLPVIYYPSMLNIQVDGHKVDYYPSFSKDLLLATVYVAPGQHEIKVDFVGLVWANWLSGITWVLLLVACMVLLVLALLKRNWRWQRVGRVAPKELFAADNLVKTDKGGKGL